MLNQTYNSRTLKGRVSKETLAAIKQAEDIAEQMESNYKSLSESTMLSEAERKEAFGELPAIAATQQAEILQEKISDLGKNIDTGFNPENETIGNMWINYTQDRIKQAIKNATPNNGQSPQIIDAVGIVREAVRASGSTMPAKVALALPLDVSYLRMDVDREEIKLMIQTDEDKEQIEKLQKELHAVRVNATALANKHTELEKQLVAPVRYKTIGNVQLRA